MQTSSSMRLRNQLGPPRIRNNVKLELNMSQVDEDNNESNVTNRTKTSDDIRKDSSYFKPRSKKNSDTPKITLTDKSYSKILGDDKEEDFQEKKQEEEEDQVSSASERSSDLSSSSQDEEMEKKRQSLLTSKQQALFHRQSILKRQSTINHISSICITIPIQLSNLITSTYFEEEFIISRRSISKYSAIIYLFEKKIQGHNIFTIDQDYEPQKDENTRVRNQASLTVPQQSKKGLFSPLTSPKSGGPVQMNKIEVAASILMTFTRNEKISRRLSRINPQQVRKSESSSESDDYHKKIAELQFQEEKKASNSNESEKQSSSQDNPTSQTFKFKAKLQNILKHQKQKTQKEQKELELQSKLTNYEKAIQKLKITSKNMKDLLKKKYIESVKKLSDYYLEEDNEDQQHSEGEENDGVTDVLSEKAKNKLMMYCKVLFGSLGFLLIIFILSYIKVSYKLESSSKNEAEVIGHIEDL